MAKRQDDMRRVVEKMASLARLRFDAAMRDDFTKKAQAVLAYVEQLNELDTSGIDPTSHAAEFATPLRADETQDSGIQEALLKAAPASDGGFVQVPKVLEGEGA